MHVDHTNFKVRITGFNLWIERLKYAPGSNSICHNIMVALVLIEGLIIVHHCISHASSLIRVAR